MDCYVVDSFAEAPGAGNQAGVVLMAADTVATSQAPWMQKVAAEFNYSETAFCWRCKEEDTNGSKKEEHWNIRYFTPTVEVALCGHATLAAAAILHQTTGIAADNKVVFHASEDTLTMDLAGSSSESKLQKTKITMDFPAKVCEGVIAEESKLAVKTMLKSAFACEVEPLYAGVSKGGDLLVDLPLEAFNKIPYDNVDYRALLQWEGYDRGVILCASNDQAPSEGNSAVVDFVSRFFAPKAGVDEDPVTGSAHCALCPYFAKKLGKNSIVGKQASKRGGIVECELSSDRVRLTGQAITTMSGTLWM